MLKKILWGLGIVIALPLLAALLVKKQYHVETHVVIAQPTQVVFDYVRFLTNQDNYSVWASMDPNMQKSHQGIDGTVGFVSGWHSENPDVGTGEQEIKAIVEGERIDYELRFYQPFNAVSPAYMLTESVSEKETRVRWGFTGNLPYPMNLMLLFVDVEGMIAADLQQGLDNLKLIMEAPATEAEPPPADAG